MSVRRPNRLLRSLAGALLLVAFAAASAHHSIAAFDLNKVVTLTGIVTDVKWVNPHTFVFISVTGSDGKQTQWSILSGTPTLNVRNGWKYGDVKRGDKVTVEVNPARDPKVHSGTLRHLELPDGRVIAGPREFIVVPGSKPGS